MFNTFSKSFELTKQSFNVLKEDKELILFPFISLIAEILLLCTLFAPLYIMFGRSFTNLFHSNFRYLFLFLYYILSYFVVIFFNTGLITCVYMKLEGRNATFKDGMKNAVKHIHNIFIWAVISSTVGVILQIISDKSHFLGRFIISIIGFAWNLLTFFVVPILVLENKNAFDAIKESGHLFKKTWGENVVGGISIYLFFVLLVILGFLPTILGLFLAIYLGGAIIFLSGLIITFLSWVIMIIISASLNVIFQTALYIYGTTGKVPSVYNPDLIKQAFKKK